jgi:hypothetical protein
MHKRQQAHMAESNLPKTGLMSDTECPVVQSPKRRPMTTFRRVQAHRDDPHRRRENQ